MKTEKRPLPKVADFYTEDPEAYKTDELLRLLNSDPPEAWIKKHEGVPYLPVDKVETLLTRIFRNWTLEIKQAFQAENSAVVIGRLHVTNPVTGEAMYQDGIGGCPFQTASGKPAADMAAIKNNSVQLAFPAAESYALKDAAEKFGKVFGKDLSRKNTIAHTPVYDGEQEVAEAEPTPPEATPTPAVVNPFLNQPESPLVNNVQMPDLADLF